MKVLKVKKHFNLSLFFISFFSLLFCCAVGIAGLSSMFNTIGYGSIETDNAVEFVYTMAPDVEVGETQRIFISFNNAMDAKNSKLEFHKEGYEPQTIAASVVSEEVAEFDISYTKKEEAGKYTLDNVYLGRNQNVFQKMEVFKDRGYTYAVHSKPESYSEDEIPAGIYDISGSGEISEDNKIDKNSAKMMLSNDAMNLNPSKNGPFVVALDPGHGGWDPGACGWRGAVTEKGTNLRIAQACRDELLQYSGVSVYMVRDSDEYVGLQERVERARANGANLFVCLHCNSGGGYGAEVWVQHPGGWQSGFFDIGSAIGNDILGKLQARFGLNNRGIKYKYCTDGSTYPDGSQGDYYTVLFWSRYYSIPGILVEHAFIDTETEFLADDRNLIALGIADAEAIADVYGFTKNAPRPHIKWMDDGMITFEWAAIPGATKYAVYRVEGSSYVPYDENYHNTVFTANDLVNGNEYQFLVQAYVNGHWSKFTERDYFTVRLLPVPWPIQCEPKGDGEVELSWKVVTNATKYAVAEFKNNEYVTYDYDVRPTGDTCRFLVSNLSCGTEHKFLIQACFLDTWWSYYDDTCLTTCIAKGPCKPYNVKAKPGMNSISFSWDSIPGVVSYNIAVDNGSGKYINYYTDSLKTEYTISDLDCSWNYSCLVQAYFDIGKYSDFNEEDIIKVKTLDDPSRPYPSAVVGDGTVTLTWPKVQDASKYAIYKVEGGRFIPYTEERLITTYEITNLSNYKEHTFLVQAYSNGVWSKFHEGNYVKATPIGPTKPTISDHVSGSHSIRLVWDNVAGATRYAIASLNPSGIFKTYTLDCQNSFYTVVGLEEGKEYKFLVQAFIDGCWSEFDISKDLYLASTEDTRPKPEAKTGNDGEIILNWEEVKNVENYAIYEVMDSGAYIPFDENFKGTSYVAKNLPNGYFHKFLVQAKVAGTWSTISSELFTMAEAKGNVKPYDIYGVSGSRSIELTWGHVAGASQYAIATKSASGSYTTYTLNCTSENYVVNGLVEDCEYKVLIQACIYGRWSAFVEKEDLKTFKTVNTKPVPFAKKSGDGKVTLTWNAIKNAERYAVYEVIENSFKAIDENVTKTTYEVTNLANFYYHNFLVQSYVGGSWSTIDPYLYDGDTPEGYIKPWDVDWAAGYRQITLTWSQVSGAEKYAVATRNEDGTYTTHTLDCIDNTYTIKNLQDGKVYLCLVQAYIMGNWSAFNEKDDLVESITFDTRPVIDKNSPTGDGSVTLRWGAVSYAEKYAIYEVMGKGIFRKITEECPKTITEYLIDNLANGYEHTFLVQAYVAWNWSTFDSSNFVTFFLNGTTKPVNLDVVSDVANHVTISWGAVPGAEKYAIARQISGNSFYTYTTSCTDLSYSLYIRGGETYKFLVQAYVMGKWSEFDLTQDLFDVTPLNDPDRPKVHVDKIDVGYIDLSWPAIPNATRYAVATKNGDGSYKTYTYDCTDTKFTITGLFGGEYLCLVQSFKNGWSEYNDGDLVFAEVPSSLTPIMHSSRTTVQQMVNYFNASGHAYEYGYANYGAPDIKTFCTICYQEATDEGVDPAVLFCQAMLETGWLGFTGRVKWWQCNFGGIGATDSGGTPNTFNDVREGLRAQAQHLKAYGSRYGDLVHPRVDPRFHFVTRGICPNVEDLGGHWASGASYGYSIVALMQKLFNY